MFNLSHYNNDYFCVCLFKCFVVRVLDSAVHNLVHDTARTVLSRLLNVLLIMRAELNT